MKIHREGTGLLLSLFSFLFIVNLLIYYTIGKGGIFYVVLSVSSGLFLLILNFFRSPSRRFPTIPKGWSLLRLMVPSWPSKK